MGSQNHTAQFAYYCNLKRAQQQHGQKQPKPKENHSKIKIRRERESEKSVLTQMAGFDISAISIFFRWFAWFGFSHEISIFRCGWPAMCMQQTNHVMCLLLSFPYFVENDPVEIISLVSPIDTQQTHQNKRTFTCIRSSNFREATQQHNKNWKAEDRKRKNGIKKQLIRKYS